MYTLEFFKKSFSLDHVKEAMTPGPSGISMLEIRNVLTGYGLEVLARKRVRGKDLKTIFADGQKRLVIMQADLSRQQHKLGHFYIILPTKQNSGKEYWLVNVGLGDKEKSTKEINEYLELGNGTILIVSQANNSTNSSDDIEVKPTVLDFGSIRTHNEEKPKKDLTVTNTSDHPIMINKINLSCSCSVTNWAGGLLGPGHSKTFSVTVDPKGWGRGEQNKKVTLFFGDDSRKTVTIKGTGQIPETLQGLQPAPKELYFRLSSKSPAQTDCTKTVYVSNLDSKSQQPFSLDTSGSAKWLEAKIESQPKDQLPGKVRVQIKPEFVKEKDGHSQFALYTDATEDPVIVPIHVVKKHSYEVSPRFVMLNSSSKDKGETVIIKSNNPEDESIKIIKASSEPAIVTNINNDTGNGTSTIKITAADNLPKAGLYKINLTLSSSVGETTFETVSVLVSK